MMKSDMNDWQRINESYLAHSLNWLRLRLNRLAQTDQADEQLEREIAATAQEIQALAEGELLPSALIIGQLFGLSAFEQQVLFLCAAMELDTRMPALCAAAQDHSQRAYPTLALALALFDGPSWEALSPERPLRYWQLIEIAQQAGQPLISAPIKADERIVNAIRGLNHLDDRLQSYLLPLARAELDELPTSQRTTKEKITRYLTANLGELPLIQLTGSDDGSKQLIAEWVAIELGLHIYRLPVGLLPLAAGDLDLLLRLWLRETILQPVGLYLETSDSQPEETDEVITRFTARTQGVVFLAVRETLPDPGRASISIGVNKPTPAEQLQAWQQFNGHSSAPQQLASQFDLNLPAIRQVATWAQANGNDLWETCLIATRPRLDTLAQAIDAKATWEDLILPEEELTLLKQLPAQVRGRSQVYDQWGFRQRMNRGLGITALFAGESGTGKTMAAEVLANELRLNLYRIDLSQVVSKYIGETEKNLRQLFDAAEDGGAILFFDEADALFGKRSEVKDSHDRYANIEINYLLQRMEAYRGLAILATNMKSALDQAFMRRLRFVINFPFPGREERKRIWQQTFPPQTPLADLDYEHLSRLTLTGGSIHNTAINAAFLAAQADRPVGMDFILQAARAEFVKVGRAVNELDFNYQEPAGVRR
jgi:hypothetical protein